MSNKQRSKNENSPYIQALYETALAQHLKGNRALAEPAYREILAQAPGHADTWHALGVLADETKRHALAIEYIEKAIALSNRKAVYYSDLGNALKNAGMADKALVHYRRAVALAPTHFAHNNLALALKDKGLLQEAVDQFHKALALKSDVAEVHNNLGLTLKEQGEIEEALPHYEHALALSPHYPAAHWNRGVAAFLRGDLLAGWRGNEYREHLVKADYTCAGPRWQGEELAGKTILLSHEQGFGDTLHFIRYAAMVKARGPRRVLFFCQPPLAGLLKNVAGVDEIFDRLPLAGSYDYYVPLMSLPHIFATTLETIPAAIPYIPRADLAEAAARWQAQLPAAIPKIGIVWRGNPEHSNDRNRSLPAKTFARMLKNSKAQFVSVQKDPTPEELAVLKSAAPNLFEAGSLVKDFSDTAALLLNLDLVITVDTSAAHLAGALGLPVWLLLPFAPDWRWLLERTDSPWYPTMRLFRQTKYADWGPVIEAVTIALKKF